VFIAAQFFILSFALRMFFDPLGIAYFLVGVVYLLNKKLAIFEIVGIFLLKGEFIWANTAPAWMSAIHDPALRSIAVSIMFVEIPMAWLLGAIIAVQISAKIMYLRLQRQAPDLLGMITK